VPDLIAFGKVIVDTKVIDQITDLTEVKCSIIFGLQSFQSESF